MTNFINKIKKYFLKNKTILQQLPQIAHLDTLIWDNPDINLGDKNIYFLAEFKDGHYQVVHKYRLSDIWSYGDWMETREINRVLKIDTIPNEWWNTLDKDGYPTDDSICLLSYSVNHYEVAKYNNHHWITEMSFPCEFVKYLIIKQV